MTDKYDIEYGEYPVAAFIEGDGWKVEIRYEEDSSYCDPRDYDNVGTMLCAHPRYNLGDEQATQPFDTSIECDRCEGSGYDPDRKEIRDIRCYGYHSVASGSEAAMEALLPFYADGHIEEASCLKCGGEGTINLGIYEYLMREYGATCVIPLFLYDHSGITMSAGTPMGSMDSRNRFIPDSAGWDTSHVGFIFDTAENREKCGTDLEYVEQCLLGEVKEYASYLEGDVYYVTAESDDGGYNDSCGGFIGSESAEEYAREMAGYVSEYVETEAKNKLDAACRDIVTI